MSFPKHMDPLTNHPWQPNELRRLNLELDKNGALWPWVAGLIAVIVVATLVYGYTRKIWALASTQLSSSSSTPTNSDR
jgi:hypothetical protein